MILKDNSAAKLIFFISNKRIFLNPTRMISKHMWISKIDILEKLLAKDNQRNSCT
jgi:hypothetical protein